MEESGDGDAGKGYPTLEFTGTIGKARNPSRTTFSDGKIRHSIRAGFNCSEADSTRNESRKDD